ncbi:MAG: YraN family protein [Thermoleophilia bacterium]
MTAPAAVTYRIDPGHALAADSRPELGRSGEAAAARYLRRRLYSIIETNYRTRYGEIDIIARRGDVVAFVEVKARRSAGFGQPFEAVGPRKQEQLRRMALAWLAARHRDPAFSRCVFRFDVVSIVFRGNGAVERLEHLEDAFR